MFLQTASSCKGSYKHVLACLYTSFIKDERSRRRCLGGAFERQIRRQGWAFEQYFGPRGQEFKQSNQFKSSNASALPEWGWSMLKFRVDLMHTSSIKLQRTTNLALRKRPGARYSKVPKLFGRISGDIILFASSK